MHIQQRWLMGNKVIRIGDHIKVINPEFILRVGYPISFIQACAHVEKEYEEQIRHMLAKCKLYGHEPKSSFEETMFGDLTVFCHEPWPPIGRYKKPYHKIVAGLAGMYLESQGFGGKERKIYTKSYPDFKDRVYLVVDKKVVKTGIYFPPWSHQDYQGEWDGAPGGLDFEKTHVLLMLNSWHHAALNDHEPPYDTYLTIERINVEVVSRSVPCEGQILPLRR